MLIEKKRTVYDSRDDVYYTGDRGGGSIFESLNSRVHTYKTERAAKSALRYILETGGERVEFSDLRAVYIERAEVPDVANDSVKFSQSPRLLSRPGEAFDTTDWEAVDAFGKRIAYIRKKSPVGNIFAVFCDDGSVYGFGTDEAWAWTWYSDYRRDFGVNLIENRPGKSSTGERGNASQ